MTSVLIVDDDRQLRGTLQRDLVDRGYDVRTAASVAEARMCIGSARPDIVLTDLRMSEEDGIDLLGSIQELDIGIRAILMAAYAAAREQEAAIRLGAVRLLRKPFTLIELLVALRQAEGHAAELHGTRGRSLLDLLQAAHHARRSITIRVGSTGAVYVRAGEIVHATLELSEGEEALAALLALPHFPSSTAPLSSETQTISQNFAALMLNVLSRLDDESGPRVRVARRNQTFPGPRRGARRRGA
jgi:CheY-like chemotaxis protein